MSKKLRIDGCFECKYFNAVTIFGARCGKVLNDKQCEVIIDPDFDPCEYKRILPSEWPMPKWCPLEDY
jgi:hypothetical protein